MSFSLYTNVFNYFWKLITNKHTYIHNTFNKSQRSQNFIPNLKSSRTRIVRWKVIKISGFYKGFYNKEKLNDDAIILVCRWRTRKTIPENELYHHHYIRVQLIITSTNNKRFRKKKNNNNIVQLNKNKNSFT